VVGASILARFIPPAFAGGIDPDAVDGAIEQPYAIPDRVVEYVRFEPEAIPTCFWQGVGPNNTIFAAECFMDRLANKAAADPLAFRRSLLHDNPRALAVLDLAAQKAEWGSPLGPREGRGICLEAAFGSFIATIAHVAVADDGEVSVKRITSAVDCGMIVNPDGVTAQMQGGMFFGLSAALHGEITIANGRVEQSNFHDYRIVRMDEAPLIDIHLVVSGEAPGGIGEPGSVTVQPAVANAVYAAVGVQPNRMPIDRALLKKGIT
jgi:isoquinoline 1-oxidoreductase beta subunit